MWIARINAFLQENITGMSTVQLFRREARNLQRFREINDEHRQANVRSIFYYAVFYPAIELVERARHGAAALVRRRARARRHAHARHAGRVHPVRAALLPPDLGLVGEVQRPAGRDGVV